MAQEKFCDGQSVGVIIEDPEGKVVLIDRAKFPFGLSTPGGHVDTHGSPRQAAVMEALEEVDAVLDPQGLETVIDSQRFDFPCGRNNNLGYHIATIFRARLPHRLALTPDLREARSVDYYDRDQLQEVADLTRADELGQRSPEEQEVQPALEPMWRDIFVHLGYVSLGSI